MELPPMLAQSDDVKRSVMRQKIGLDLSVQDFDLKKIDSKIMGSRLAGILDYLMDNYRQPIYNRKLVYVLKEQNEVFEKVDFELNKIQLDRVIKAGEEITLYFSVWPSKKIPNAKKTTLTFYFKDGVSDSQATNDLFSMMSHYVQAMEAIKDNF